MTNSPKPRLLVVEDEVKVATFIKKGLETQGYSADVAYDGVRVNKCLVRQTTIWRFWMSTYLPSVDWN